MDRKELKKNAHQTVKDHWVFLMLAVDIAAAASAAVPLSNNELFRYAVKGIQSGSLNASIPFTGQQIFLEVLKLLAGLLISILLFRIQIVVCHRLFLEARTYQKVPVQHAFYISSVKKWTHTAFAYFRRCLYLSLWSLTIVGGMIKYYSYFLVGFILAENPSLSGKDAIALSRRMMNGHKWEAFKLQLSLLPWFLLSLATCSIAGWIFVLPYAEAVYSEYYAALRAAAAKAGMEGTEVLNDVYLFEKAEDETLQKAYKDIRLDKTYVRMNTVHLNGVQNFFLKAFGLLIAGKRNRRLYQGTEDIALQVELNENALGKEQYPFRLSPLYERKNAHFEGQMNFKRGYSVFTLLLFFILSAVIGWVLHAVGYTDIPGIAEYVSLKGPWLLSAGLIGILSLLLTGSLRNRPVFTYIVSACIAAAVICFNILNSSSVLIPYITVSAVLLTASSGLLCIYGIYIAAPWIDSQLTLKKLPVWLIALILFALFLLDFILIS